MQLELLDKLGDENAAELHIGRLHTPQGPVLVSARRLLRQVAQTAGVIEGLTDTLRQFSATAHPNLLAPLGLFRAADDLFWLSARVEGADLDSGLNRLASREVRITPLRVLQIGVDLLEGLAALHTAGLVHGGLGPRQVLVGLDGVAQLDGLAYERALMEVRELKQKVRRGRGSVLAPEVMQGRPPNESADVFSAAALLYTLLTGNPPLADKDRGGASVRHVAIQPPSKLDRSLPFACDAVFVKALSIAPRNRHESGEALHNAVARLRKSLLTGPDEGRQGVCEFVRTLFPNEALVAGGAGTLQRPARGPAIELEPLAVAGAPPELAAQPAVVAPEPRFSTQETSPAAVPLGASGGPPSRDELATTRLPPDDRTDELETIRAGPTLMDWHAVDTEPVGSPPRSQSGAAAIADEETDELEQLGAQTQPPPVVHDTREMEAATPPPLPSAPRAVAIDWRNPRVRWVAGLAGALVIALLLWVFYLISGETRVPALGAPAGTTSEIGFLSIESGNPAKVTLDGEVLAGTTPLKGRLVRAGTHRLVLKDAAGRVLLDDTLEVAPGEHKELRVVDPGGGGAVAPPPNPDPDPQLAPEEPQAEKKPVKKPTTKRGRRRTRKTGSRRTR